MATTITRYTSYNQYIHDGTIDLDATNIYLALVTDAYTFSAANTIWANVSGSECAATGNYTTGGKQLTNSVNTTRWDADDVTWTALTHTFKFGVLYVNATVNSIVKPLIACILFDSTPANISITGGDFTIQFNTSGIITFA
jgi:hypothetical protein